MSNVLIYLPSHSFLYEFGDVAEVGYWSIILKSVSVKTSFFQQGCDMYSLETGWETALLWGVVHNICNRSQEYTDTIKDQ